MLLESLADDGTVSIVVFHRPDLRNPSQCFEGLVVELVYVGHVRIRDDDERQGLHVA